MSIEQNRRDVRLARSRCEARLITRIGEIAHALSQLRPLSDREIALALTAHGVTLDPISNNNNIYCYCERCKRLRFCSGNNNYLRKSSS